jgi:hypothetical protein
MKGKELAIVYRLAPYWPHVFPRRRLKQKEKADKDGRSTDRSQRFRFRALISECRPSV